MKLVGALGLVLGGAMIIGCGSSAPRTAKAPADIMDTVQAELSRSISTTTVTSAPLPAAPKPKPDLNPRYLSIDEEPAPVQTWGAAAHDPADPTEASDLAANPYTTDATPKRDIYDPR